MKRKSSIYLGEHGHKSISGFTFYKTENIIQKPGKLEEERGKSEKGVLFY